MKKQTLLGRIGAMFNSITKQDIKSSWFSGEGAGDGIYTESGVIVTPDTAISLSAVYACVRILSETMATFPLEIYKRTADGGKEAAREHPLWRVLARKPNEIQTSFEFREMMQAHLSLRGNAYAEKVRTAGRITALIPIHPDRVIPEISNDGRVQYKVSTRNGLQITVGQDRILHLRGMTFDGLNGISPIQAAKQSIGNAMAAEAYSGRFFKNNATPSGILEHEGKLDPADKQTIKDQWNAAMSGKNQHSIGIADRGLKYKPISITAEDAQLIEAMRFGVESIARIYRIPKHMLADLEKSAFSNITHQSLEFVMYTMLPWVNRWENALECALLNEIEQEQYIIEFNVSGLLRGDQKSRYESYAIGRQWGWLSPNDIRRLENMNPIDGGNEYYEPLNMQPLGSGLDNNAKTNNSTDSEPSGGSRFNLAFSQTLQSQLERAATAEAGALDKLHKRYGTKPSQTELDRYRDERRDYLQKITQPVFDAIATGTDVTPDDIAAFSREFSNRCGGQLAAQDLRSVSLDAVQKFTAYVENKTLTGNKGTINMN